MSAHNPIVLKLTRKEALVVAEWLDYACIIRPPTWTNSGECGAALRVRSRLLNLLRLEVNGVRGEPPAAHRNPGRPHLREKVVAEGVDPSADDIEGAT
jgi:hypothetical protein